MPASDAAQRERVLAPDKSFIVRAPAGSGKTGLLVQRILRLLGVVERPESIIAVTFTIKAAAEMRERVVKALEEASIATELTRDEFRARTVALARNALDQDKRYGWNLLEDPSRLHVQTIDALCASLVRQMPLVSEAGGISKVLEDADDLYREAARLALQSLADGRADGGNGPALFRRLSLHFDNNIAALERQIAAMLAKRDQWHAGTPDLSDGTVRDFSAILTFAEFELRNVFRRHHAVDFTEVTRAAIKALGEPEAPSDLLYALDYRIEHLLVDEFQDTSRAQFNLLEALTGQWSDGDGRTLFVVGDPLQSIYGFRAAEVQLFQRCWEKGGLGSVRLYPVQLDANFRSTPEIVEWVQSRLSSVLPDTDISRGAVKLEPVVAARQVRGESPALIPLLDDYSGAAEAKQVVDILRSAKDLGEVAILGRSRSHVLTILAALREASIRYEAVEIDPLGEQQHILDLLALTRALHHPADRVAWLACLRAPWCGMTLADLAALAEGERDKTIIDLLPVKGIVPHVSASGAFRAAAFYRTISTALEMAGRIPIRTLVESTWYDLGGPAILSKPNEREDAGRFFNLLEACDDGGAIRNFDSLNAKLERLYARPDASDECIRVMTIHEAKGLEFDTVILPHLDKAPRGEDEELLVWNETVEDDGSVTLAVAAQPRKGESCAAYDAIRQAAKEKVRSEGKRLFYVACTRAKNHLYLLGSAKQNARKTDLCKAQSHTFLGMIWDAYKPEFQKLQRRAVAVQAGLFADERKSRCIQRLRDGGYSAQFASAVAWQSGFERGTASDRKLSYKWVGGASRHVGTIVHGVVNRIAREGLGAWSEARVELLRGAIADELARAGADERNRASATEQSLRAIRQAIGSERGRWILSEHPEAVSEWPIVGRVGARLITGMIDRMFRDDEGRLWIVDYKTSEHQGGNVQAFLDREQRRYQAQMEAYAALIGAIKDGPISLGLYFPLLDGWRSWDAAEAAETAR